MEYAELPHGGSWRSAVENYLPRVSCRSHLVVDDVWLNAVRLEVQREFSAVLAGLDTLDAAHPLNDRSLSVKLEVAVDAHTGCLLAMGVLKSSTLQFEIGVLESVRRASPFEAYPQAATAEVDEIDLHWEFHRDPNRACSGECVQGFVALEVEQAGLR